MCIHNKLKSIDDRCAALSYFLRITLSLFLSNACRLQIENRLSYIQLLKTRESWHCVLDFESVG